MLKTASSCLLRPLLLVPVVLIVRNDQYMPETAQKNKCWSHDDHYITVAYITSLDSQITSTKIRRKRVDVLREMVGDGLAW